MDRKRGESRCEGKKRSLGDLKAKGKRRHRRCGVVPVEKRKVKRVQPRSASHAMVPDTPRKWSTYQLW